MSASAQAFKEQECRFNRGILDSGNRILWQDGQVGPPIHALFLHEALITKLTSLFLSHF